MAPESTPPDELIGATIAGRYRIISQLGVGGMGVAYRAWDEQVGMPVVIKIPKRIFLEDAGFAERFQREIRLLKGLKHPHIVPILDVGDHEGRPFVVMRLLPGGSLSNRRLRDEKGKPRPIPPAMLHLWLPAVADALDYVYSQGVVHRDVKPANIFFDAFWGAYLGDFGIAKIVEESDTFDREHTLTATQMGIGTQEYMAPEQFTPKAVVDGRADQYALAVMVYEMLAGERPFTGATAHIVVEVTTYPVPPLPVRRSDVSPLVVQAIHKALSKHPAERFNTCREFATAVLRDVPPMTDEPGVARLLCPQCSNILKLPTTAAGQKGKCPKCQTQMKVADDLATLWLLEETRKQRKAPDVGGVESPRTPSGEIDEKALETFKPVSGETPIEKSGKRRWTKPAWIYLGGATAVATVLLVLAAITGGGSKPPPPPPPPQPSYEIRLAETWQTLKRDPLDQHANEFVARHYCFKERNWEKGLPYLAKSGMQDAAALAQEEIAANETKPINPGTMVRLARKWWEYGRRRDLNTPESAAATRIYAGQIYRENVLGINDPSDADWANSWLDSDEDFRGLVANKRPPRRGPMQVFLSDLQETASKVVHFGFGKGTINGSNNPIYSIIDGKTSPHGLSMHPGDGPDGHCFVTYSLPKGVQRFAAVATLNQSGSFEHCGIGFEVFADGKSVWKSQTINNDHRSEACEVPIGGCQTLELRTYAVTAAFGGHAVWIEPRIYVENLESPSGKADAQTSSRAARSDDAPLQLAVNGLGGQRFLRPSTFGPDWQGFNPPCNGDEKAWIKDGAFACIASQGALEWPALPETRYVCNFEIEFTGREKDFRMYFGDPKDAAHINFDYIPDRNVIRTTFLGMRPWGFWWTNPGFRDLEPNKKHAFQLIVGDNTQSLLVANEVAGGLNAWPADCRLRIFSGTASGTIIHGLSMRPLGAADAQLAAFDLPVKTVEGMPSAAARRIERLVAGLSDQPAAGKRVTAAVTGSPMAWIPPGIFEMGSQRPEDAHRQTVRISKGLWISQTEVTQREYQLVMGANPSRINGSEYLPVDWVSWEDCQEFCRRLNEAARKRGTLPEAYEYRLPTEAEWEYCCRAGSREDFSVPQAAVWSRDRSGRRPCEVAESDPNAWGLYDMHGNAMEWCLDRWYDYQGRTSLLQTDPCHPGKPELEAFVVRGGAWWCSQDECSSHWRTMCANKPAGGYRGFRVALAPVHRVIRDKTLVVWTTLANLDQRGGGVLSLQDPRGEFDAIVFGEAEPRRWLVGSDWKKRWPPAPADVVQENAPPSELVQIVVVYSGSSIALFRNGVVSVRYETDATVPFRVADAKVLLGTRGVPVPGNELIVGEIDDARVYGTALTSDQIRALIPNKITADQPLAWWHFEDGRVVDAMGSFPEAHSFGGARVDGGRLVLNGSQAFVVCSAGTSPVPETVLNNRLVADYLASDSAVRKKPAVARGEPLDLLPLIDPQRDAVSGAWKRIGEELESGDEPWASLAIPVRPPREYEYLLEFTRREGEEAVGQFCSVTPHGFILALGGWRNSVLKLERDAAGDVVVQRRAAWITNGKRHTSIIRIERDNVSVTFDGEKILAMPMEWARMSHHPEWKIPDEMLGIGSWRSPTRFHRATITEIDSRREAKPEGDSGAVRRDRPRKPHDLRRYIFSGDHDANVKEAREMLLWLGATITAADPDDGWVTGRLKPGVEVTIWPKTYGKPSCYGIRFGTPHIRGPDDNYFEVCREAVAQ